MGSVSSRPGSNWGLRLTGELLVCLLLGLMGAAAGRQYLGLALTPSSVWAAMGFLAFAPALEELVFRVLLQQGLARWMSGHAANGMAAIAFALSHAPQEGWRAIWWVLPSLLLGELWRRHRLWWPCALLHASFNLSLLAVTAYL